MIATFSSVFESSNLMFLKYQNKCLLFLLIKFQIRKKQVVKIQIQGSVFLGSS
jgi:hypothetical protein